ncbi:MAG: tRNA pseudouridine(38-40) synthase TruA, partial [Duncaniella sp.]|nr:tRNA pseudouridine(38-40) synthase TruA [Duncaniella sp.]
FIITADRFLRNMVRAVVGTLVDVGRHKISIDQFRDIIDRRDRCAAGTSMPPQALFLWDVTYPEDIWINPQGR